MTEKEEAAREEMEETQQKAEDIEEGKLDPHEVAKDLEEK